MQAGETPETLLARLEALGGWRHFMRDSSSTPEMMRLEPTDALVRRFPSAVMASAFYKAKMGDPAGARQDLNRCDAVLGESFADDRGLALDRVVVGFALFALQISTGLGLARTIWWLWIGHILHSTPYVIGTMGPALAAYDTSLEEAARSLGASPSRAVRKVTLLDISQCIQAGSIFAFIVSFGQVEASLFQS